MRGPGTALAHPRRYDNLRRIQALDPEVDYDEIVNLTARHEFPWDYLQGTGDRVHARLRRAVDQPGCSTPRASSRTHGIKRYDDTLLIGEESTVDGIDSERGHAAVRRLNQIHGHYDIPNHEFAYVLATTIVGPVRWISAYGWRPLDPQRARRDDPGHDAVRRADGHQGPAHDVRRLPAAARRLRARALRPRPGQHRARRGVDRDRAAAIAPAPAASRSSDGCRSRSWTSRCASRSGCPRQPAWLVPRRVRALRLRARGLLLRFAAAAREPQLRTRATTYPGGHRLSDLGPLSMLDALNTHTHSGPTAAARSTHA